MKLIPKDAVLAEIDKVMAEEMKFYETACKEGDAESSSSPMVYTRMQMFRTFIDSLEVTEVATITCDDVRIFINNKSQKENSYDK